MACFGSSDTTKSNNFNQGTSIGTNANSFSNPQLNNFQNGLMSNISNGMAQANQPLYGQAQVSQYLNGLNGLANSSINNLQANLARRGVGGNSGQLGQGLTDINLARQGQAGNFISQLPLMNRQAQLQAAGMYGGLGNQLMSVAPRTNVSNNFTQGTGTGYSQRNYDPSVMSDIGQTVAIAAGAMGMPSSGMVSTPPGAPQGQVSGGIPGGTDQYMSYNTPGMANTQPIQSAPYVGASPYSAPQPNNLWWNQNMGGQY